MLLFNANSVSDREILPVAYIFSKKYPLIHKRKVNIKGTVKLSKITVPFLLLYLVALFDYFSVLGVASADGFVALEADITLFVLNNKLCFALKAGLVSAKSKIVVIEIMRFLIGLFAVFIINDNIFDIVVFVAVGNNAAVFDCSAERSDNLALRNRFGALLQFSRLRGA